MHKEIVNLLMLHPQGLSARRLKLLLSSNNINEVSSALRQLHAEGYVALRKGTLWQWTGKAYKIPEQIQPDENPQPTIVDPFITHGIPLGTRWDDFRKLCLYYAECVRLEDKAKAHAYANRENQSFITCNSQIDWQTLSNGGQIALSIPSEWGPFIRKIKSRNTGPRLFIGTPVFIYPLKDDATNLPNAIISPVFVQQVEFTVCGTMLYLRPVGPVEINNDWLERRFPQSSDDRRIFLEQVGLGYPDMDTDAAHTYQNILPSFDQLATALFHFYRKDWQECPNLANLSVNPILSEIRDRGLYNRGILIPQKKLQYSDKLHKELLELSRISDELLDHTALHIIVPHQKPAKKNLPSEPEEQLSMDESCTKVMDIAEYDPLNDEQREACRLALSNSLTVITGPPGTGKSRVVAQTMANAALNGTTVLFSSKNHQAVEAVIPKLLISP
jgi:hypothetical protein